MISLKWTVPFLVAAGVLAAGLLAPSDAAIDTCMARHSHATCFAAIGR